MNKKTKHIVLLSILALLFVVLLFFFYEEYKTTYKKTEVLDSKYGEFSLSIYMIGEPEFPYGSTNWGFTLYRGKTKITDETLSLFNDGKVISEDNFLVTWSEKTVTIVASSEEMEDLKFVVSLQN